MGRDQVGASLDEGVAIVSARKFEPRLVKGTCWGSISRERRALGLVPAASASIRAAGCAVYASACASPKLWIVYSIMSANRARAAGA